MNIRLVSGIVALCCLAVPGAAHAFCGFYVAGGGAEVYNNATQVVLMRDGTKTILSMQNNYEGPPEGFAMVIPVPVVLQEENVKTLDEALFAKVDQLSSPRLVEYWEEDPCFVRDYYSNNGANDGGGNNGTNNGGSVVVEAEFKVGEYEIVILSTDDSGALTTWLGDNDYNIPDGAEPHLQPYVDAGQYFFVARVIPEEVTFVDGRAVLSPLRFDYDSEEFSLPIRLGLISAEDQQDLLVYVLARNQRYEAANYDNVFIPTNLDVQDEVRENFGAFYNALFTRLVERNPGAVVTEYAWSAQGCDPCPPGGILEPSDLATLGADVLGEGAASEFGWTLTRLHARYDAGNIGEDIVFRTAPPVVGGRNWPADEDGALFTGAEESGSNNFQGRYIIRHPWEGAVECEEPVYGVWGGDIGTAGTANSPNTTGEDYRTQQANLEELLAQDVPELGVDVDESMPTRGSTGGADHVDSGCASVAPAGLLPLALLALFVWRRRT
jgi:hypothetical protein